MEQAVLKLEKISRLHMADLTVHSSIDWYLGSGSAEAGQISHLHMAEYTVYSPIDSDSGAGSAEAV
jgi:hypothetical protein